MIHFPLQIKVSFDEWFIFAAYCGPYFVPFCCNSIYVGTPPKNINFEEFDMQSEVCHTLAQNLNYHFFLQLLALANTGAWGCAPPLVYKDFKEKLGHTYNCFSICCSQSKILDLSWLFIINIYLTILYQVFLIWTYSSNFSGLLGPYLTQFGVEVRSESWFGPTTYNECCFLICPDLWHLSGVSCGGAVEW